MNEPDDTYVQVPEAVRILVRSGMNFSETAMRYRITTGRIEAKKIGRDWWVKRSELDRIREAEAKT